MSEDLTYKNLAAISRSKDQDRASYVVAQAAYMMGDLRHRYPENIEEERMKEVIALTEDPVVFAVMTAKDNYLAESLIKAGFDFSSTKIPDGRSLLSVGVYIDKRAREEREDGRPFGDYCELVRHLDGTAPKERPYVNYEKINVDDYDKNGISGSTQIYKIASSLAKERK